MKLKLGARDGLDVERVQAVRGVTRLPLQVDVNEYWELDEALENVARLSELGVEYVEQPLPSGDSGGAAPLGVAGPDLRRRGLPYGGERAGLRRDRAWREHQAGEVRRHPRGRADRPRRPGARPGRHARAWSNGART